MVIEEEAGVSIDDELISSVHTVADIVRILEENRKRKCPPADTGGAF